MHIVEFSDSRSWQLFILGDCRGGFYKLIRIAYCFLCLGMMEGTQVKQAATFTVPTGFIASVFREPLVLVPASSFLELCNTSQCILPHSTQKKKKKK